MKVIFLGIFIITLIFTLPASAFIYQNGPYRFSVRLPDDKIVCGHTPPAPNHGVNVLLDTSDCSQQLNVPRVMVNAYYNVPTEAETPEELSDEVCNGNPVKKTTIKIGKTSFYKCLNEISDAQITYFALRKHDSKTPESWIIYQLTNYCGQSECNAGLVKNILASMRFK